MLKLIKKPIANLYKPQLIFIKTQKRFSINLTTLCTCFFGVPILVYSYKCLVLVIFQSKLIYMNYLPLGSRNIDTTESFEKLKNEKLVVNPLVIPHKSKVGRANLPWPLNIGASNIILNGYIFEGRKTVIKNSEQHNYNIFFGIGSARFSNSTTDLIKVKCPQDLIVVYFQGNGGNMVHRFELFKKILGVTEELNIKTSIFALHLRGYGNSSGSPSQAGIIEDSLVLFSYIQNNYPDSKIILYGHSLGGAVTFQLLKRITETDKIIGLVIENTFTSIYDMVVSMYPSWLPYRFLARHFLLSPWDSVKAINNISCLPPTLCLSATKDDVVPSYMMLQLRSLLNSKFKNINIDTVYFPYAHHNNVYEQHNFNTAWKMWLQKIFPTKKTDL